MPLSTSIRIRRIAATAAVALFGLTGTAWADDDDDDRDDDTPVTTVVSRQTCVHPLIEQPFAGLGDQRDYVLAPGASFEDPALPGWTLTKGAKVVASNEPFNLRGSADGSSLSLPEDASATSPTMCVDLHYPTMRFVALQQNRREAELEVEVLYPDAQKPKWTEVAELEADSRDGWKATRDISIRPELGGVLAGGRQVALRFTSDDDDGSWLIDNVYVDPHRR